ncbi:hypothetical protein BH24ACT20_BH24ACT20_08900 [soil metagenome]
MTRGTAETARDTRSGHQRESLLPRAFRAMVFTTTFLLVLAALSVSIALVVYTAWYHDLTRGVFALIFAVLSTQMALNWLLWKDDEDNPH